MDAAGRELRDHVFNAAILRHMFEAHYSIDKFELVFPSLSTLWISAKVRHGQGGARNVSTTRSCSTSSTQL